MRADAHPNEDSRLAALYEYGILDTPPEAEFDSLVRLASAICETPVSLVSLIDAERQWFKAEVGLGMRETPIDHSLCAHAILEDDFVEIPDTEVDTRFVDNPLVHEAPGLRFYAGAPLKTPEGLPVGTLCVLDTKPRRLNEFQRTSLLALGAQVVTQLELRRKVRQLEAEREAHAKAETATRDKDEFLRIVTDRMQVRVGYVDPQYRYVFLNGEYERTFGFAPGEAWGRSVEEIVGPDAWRFAEPHIRRALAGETHTQEFTTRYPFGERRVEARYVADFAPDGMVRGVVVNALDVTARYEAERALARGRAELERTLDTAEVATWHWDIANDRTYASPRLQFFFDLSDENANGGPVVTYLAAMHADDRPRVAEALAESSETGARYEVEYRVLGADGRERWVLARGSATFGEHGKAVALSGVLVDITERKRDEEELRKRNERVRLLSEGSADMLAKGDPAEMVSALYARIKDALGLAGFFHFMAREEGPALRLEAYDGVPAPTAQSIGEMDQGSAGWGLVAETREPVRLNRLQESDAPFARLVKPLGFRTYACFPLIAGDRLIGTLAFASSERDEFDASDLEFLGTVARYVAIARERLRAEAAQGRLSAELLETEARFRAAQESSPDGFMVFESLRGPDGRIEDFVWRHVNEAGARFVGKPRDGFDGKRLLVELPANEALGMFDGYVRVVETGEPWTYEMHYKGDGIDAYLRTTAVKVDDGFAASFVDLTERRKAEEALRQSEERFRAVFENAPDDAIVLMNADLTLVEWNPAAEAITGWSAGQAIGQRADLFFTPEDRAAGVPEQEAAKAARNGKVPDERWHLRRDGSLFWGSGTMNALYKADGTLRGFVKVFRDATERHEMERRIRDMNEELEAKVVERTRELQETVREAEGFNYSISHDLRTPLRAIVSTASILREELGPELNEDHRELLDRQAFNAGRLGRLIDELLRLSRLSRVEVNREAIDMTAKARSVADEIDPARDVDVQEGMVARGDKALVRTVMQNLIGNAFKFSPDDSTVRVGETAGTFWVRDEGVGFDMKYAPKLFLPFERLVTEEEFPGTGIGLANVERIVRRHGGRIWAESEPGKGATFFFTLEQRAP